MAKKRPEVTIDGNADADVPPTTAASWRELAVELNAKLIQTTAGKRRLAEQIGEISSESTKWRRLAEQREQIVAEVRSQFADLKQRLENALSQNERMRGYIARVREDDVAREELVATGDVSTDDVSVEAGAVKLVPKRKFEENFARPGDFSEIGERVVSLDENFHLRHERNRPQPKHWVTY